MWWSTTLFILLGAVIWVSALPPCPRNEVPNVDLVCEINWKSRDKKQALATCLEYFPTTFVKGEPHGENTKCTVTAAYQCAGKHKDEAFLMFDKCYYFPKDSAGKYSTGKITDYKNKCDGDKLSVFYSSIQAKFIGMKAHSLGIKKLWIGMTADGRSIENPDTMIHKELWKLVKGDYWDGETLTKVTGDAKYPDDAKHFFMRTRTDHVYNRWQGSFERANGAKTDASFVCESEAKFNDKQKWYCDKLGKEGLGMDAVFDNGDPEKHEKPRCLYVSSSLYSFSGKAEDRAKGCAERPSKLHSANMDDGAGGYEYYRQFTNPGPLRLAAFRIPRSNTVEGGNLIKEKCQGGYHELRQFFKWRHYDHQGKIQYAAVSQIQWDSNYPLNECSDFPDESITMGVKRGMKIDMPPQVRAPVICSIWFFQECENINPCGSDFVCTNQRTYHTDKGYPEYKGFYTCNCPKPNGEIKDLPYNIPFEIIEDPTTHKRTCKWYDDSKCAWFDFVRASGRWENGEIQWLSKNVHVDLFGSSHDKYWDTLQQAVVRKGCKVTARSLYLYDGREKNNDLLHEVEYGVYEVPTKMNKKLIGEWSAMGAITAECWCTY